MDSDHNEYEGDGRTGLYNLGNTCFLNAIVQCLSHTDPLRQYFLSTQMERDLKATNTDKEGMVAYYFALLLRQIWSGKFRALRPTKLNSTISSLTDNFYAGDQQDGHELLTLLLMRLHTDLNRIRCNSSDKFTIDDNCEQNVRILAKLYWNRFKASNESIIVDLFYFQPLSVVECSICSKASYNMSEDCYIPVPIIEDHRTVCLYDCLDEYFSEEYLRDGNEWFCPKCKRKQEARKSYKLWSLPPIAIIQLKRFGFDNNFCLRKISTEVRFPINDLDLSAYCSPESNHQNKTYNLYAVVNHTGSLSNGHYIAYAKSSHDNFRSGWRRFDDHIIDDINESQVMTRYAYILFYRRNDL